MLCHIEKQVARIQKKLRLFSLLADLQIADRVHLKQLGAVGLKPGVALLLRADLIAVEQLHILHGCHFFSVLILHRHRPLGLIQAKRCCNGFFRKCRHCHIADA